jgi:hypothetical protein
MKTSLLTFFAAGILTLCLSGCEKKNPILREESFLGDWYTIKGDVEAYSFLKDSNSFIFVGTQGMHPVMYGTWKIDKAKFIITMDNGTTTRYSFKLTNDTLIFNEGKEIYTRTMPLEVKYPEVRILRSLTADFSRMKFSSPRSAGLNWGYRTDSTQSSQTFSLKGFSISAGTSLSSDDVSEISNYIKDYGFENDTVYVPAACIGFRDNNQIVILCTGRNPESANDSIYIHITSGLILK